MLLIGGERTHQCLQCERQGRPQSDGALVGQVNPKRKQKLTGRGARCSSLQMTWLAPDTAQLGSTSEPLPLTPSPFPLRPERHISRHEMGLISLLYTGHHMAWESWLNFTNGWLVQALIGMINSVGTRGLLSSNPWLVRVTNPSSPTRSHSGGTLMACR